MTVEQYIRNKGPGISPWISKFGIPKYEFFCDFFLYTEHQISAVISTFGNLVISLVDIQPEISKKRDSCGYPSGIPPEIHFFVGFWDQSSNFSLGKLVGLVGDVHEF